MGDNQTMNERVSVIVTCFNLEEYLDECIASIKAQVSPVDSIIVIHDGCSGKAVAYDGVTTVFLDKNVGVAKARDIGFKLSKNKWIIFFDGDDVMPANYIMEMKKVVNSSDADVVYPSCVIWAGWGDSGLKNGWHEAPKKIVLKKMLKQNEVLMPSMFKRDWYEEVGGFDSSLPLFEDFAFWLEILTKGAIFKKSNAFLMYRQRTLSRNHQNDELKTKTYQKIVKNFTLVKKKSSKV